MDQSATSNRYDACGSHPAGPAEATRDRAAGSHEARGRGRGGRHRRCRPGIDPALGRLRPRRRGRRSSSSPRSAPAATVCSTPPSTCRVQSVPVAGQTAIMSVYEGSSPGPTLRVRPGDTLRVNLVNKLDDLPPGLPDNSPFLCAPMSHGRRRRGEDVRHEPPCPRIARLARGQLGQHLPPRHGRRELPVRVPDPGRTIPPASTGTTRTCTAGRPIRSSAAWRERSSSRATSTPCPGSPGSPSGCSCSRRRSSTPTAA